jgi:hypothetical protein
MMRVHDRLLSLVGKMTEYITTPAGTRLPFYSHGDGVLTEAADSMMS